MNNHNNSPDTSGQKNIIQAIFKKLTPKSLLILLIIALFLISIILGFAVYKGGSEVNIFGIKISPSTKYTLKLLINFEPKLSENINLRSEQVTVTGYTKSIEGKEKQIKTLKIIKEGGMEVQVEVPDFRNPLYIKIDTPPGTWITDDFLISQTNLKAYFVKKENNNQ
ncbi:MAG: hypothetical protein P8078_05670 [bacterium]